MKTPELLLIFYIFLPKTPLVVVVLLSQIRAIHIARQAEKTLNLDLDNDSDKSFGELLSAFGLDPVNATAYAYLGLLAPNLDLFGHPIPAIRRKISNNQFEFSKHTVDQSILRRIRVNEIKEAIANSHLIEDYPNDKHGSSYLIGGLTQTGRSIHIKCSYPNRQLIKIVAVYEPNPELWNEDFTIRRSSSDEQ